jgi:hypothetical protein
MTREDRFEDAVVGRLAALPALAPTRELSHRIRATALARLRPRPLHPAWALAVGCAALVYLFGALNFVMGLF